MSTPCAISVIMPTYNRRPTLERALEHLAAQTVGADALQVIVCDDGSTDDTLDALAARSDPFELAVVTQSNAGPAAARNRGLRLARAPYVLFLNDDTLLAADAVERHLAAQQRLRGERLMVLGTFELPDEFAATRLGHLLTHTEHLFQYCMLRDGDVADHNFAYTCNLSLPTAAARETGFDERFTGPAAEDIDFGFRLGAKGWAVYHDAGARSRHDHVMTVRSLGRTSRMRGRGQATYFHKHGLSRAVLSSLKKFSAKRDDLAAEIEQSYPLLERTLEHVAWNPEQQLEEGTYLRLAGVFGVGYNLGILDDAAISAAVAA